MVFGLFNSAPVPAEESASQQKMMMMPSTTGSYHVATTSESAEAAGRHQPYYGYFPSGDVAIVPPPGMKEDGNKQQGNYGPYLPSMMGYVPAYGFPPPQMPHVASGLLQYQAVQNDTSKVSPTVNVHHHLPMRDIGDVTLEFFDFKHFCGRAGPIIFYLLGKQVKHEQAKHDFFNPANWAIRRRELRQSGLTGTLPVIWHNSRGLAESHAVIRYLAKRLGEYGSDHIHDSYCDMAADKLAYWRDDIMGAILACMADEFKTAATYADTRPTHYEEAELLLRNAESEGPFFMGSKPCFADYILFACIYDDNKIRKEMLDVIALKRLELKEAQQIYNEPRPVSSVEADDALLGKAKDVCGAPSDGSPVKETDKPTHRTSATEDVSFEELDKMEEDWPELLHGYPRLSVMYEKIAEAPLIERWMAQRQESEPQQYEVAAVESQARLGDMPITCGVSETSQCAVPAANATREDGIRPKRSSPSDGPATSSVPQLNNTITAQGIAVQVPQHQQNFLRAAGNMNPPMGQQAAQMQAAQVQAAQMQAAQVQAAQMQAAQMQAAQVQAAQMQAAQVQAAQMQAAQMQAAQVQAAQMQAAQMQAAAHGGVPGAGSQSYPQYAEQPYFYLDAHHAYQGGHAAGGVSFPAAGYASYPNMPTGQENPWMQKPAVHQPLQHRIQSPELHRSVNSDNNVGGKRRLGMC